MTESDLKNLEWYAEEIAGQTWGPHIIDAISEIRALRQALIQTDSHTMLLKEKCENHEKEIRRLEEEGSLFLADVSDKFAHYESRIAMMEEELRRAREQLKKDEKNAIPLERVTAFPGRGRTINKVMRRTHPTE